MVILVGDGRSGWRRRGTCLPIMPIQAIDGVDMVGTMGIGGASGSEILISLKRGLPGLSYYKHYIYPKVDITGCCLLQGSLLAR